MAAQEEKNSTETPESRPESAAEAVKRNSVQLRGTIGETLRETEAARFSDSDEKLLKFHGTYQQYDRDTATERKKQKLDKDWSMMVRLRAPGGRLTAEQYLDLDAVSSAHADGSLRITTRQTIQFHVVPKDGLKPLIRGINETLLTTMATCGDIVRNVTATPAPIRDAKHAALNRLADRISTHFLPNTTAYHEIWLDDERVDEQRTVAEPLYGATYLPRKFKIGLAAPDDNAIDVLTNDIGIIALSEDSDIPERYLVCVGGGLGMTHNKPATYPRLATPLLTVGDEEALIAALEAIVKVQRDYGDRENRKHARLKYLVQEQGDTWMREQVEAYAGRSFDDPEPVPDLRIPDHLGWHEQGDGKRYIGIGIPSGRIKDGENGPYATALRGIVDRFRPTVILMPSQDIILADVDPADAPEIDATLEEYGITRAETLTPLRRWALACPALPTCGLALTEAERVRPQIVDQVQARLDAHDLGNERISLRITGCPNGCTRPYAGDIGIVGRTPGTYALFVGGDFEGTRLNAQILDKVPMDKIGDRLDPLFAAYAAGRADDESFGDWCNRQGVEALMALADQSARQEAA